MDGDGERTYGAADVAAAEFDPAVLSAVERRLARLRYDLHDGPQQDVHLLALDLELFRRQLLPSIERDPNRGRLLGRLDDLAAQLAALDGDLRRLATTVQSPLVTGSFRDRLSEIAGSFTARTGLEPGVSVAGDFSSLTDSRQIALLSVIREALSNIRRHAEATTVSIAVSVDERGVTAEVSDDGRGFDTGATLGKAASEGHLGVVGMRERIRMLGGATTISSRPGGPTTVSVVLPPWPPAR
jgi:signal transduction histidine kinase